MGDLLNWFFGTLNGTRRQKRERLQQERQARERREKEEERKARERRRQQEERKARERRKLKAKRRREQMAARERQKDGEQKSADRQPRRAEQQPPPGGQRTQAGAIPTEPCKDHVDVWTDGSYRRSGVGGWAWTVGENDGESGAGWLLDGRSPHNMEAVAVLKALQQFRRRPSITIHTDNLALAGVLRRIAKRGSFSPKGTWSAVVKDIAAHIRAAEQDGRMIAVVWEKSHKHSPELQRADRLAKQSSKSAAHVKAKQTDSRHVNKP